MIRQIIRPAGVKTTPTNLAEGLGVVARGMGDDGPMPDWRRDFFMYYPDPELVRGTDAHYTVLRNFAMNTKATQREQIGTFGMPVCPVYRAHVPRPDNLEGRRWVVRPMYHERGQNFRLTGDRNDFIPRAEYISPFYRDRREYRFLFIRGEPVLFWNKRGDNPDQPWGGDDPQYYTITDWPASVLLRYTDALTVLRRCPILARAHIVGVDVMYSETENQNWVVLEYNFAPGLWMNHNIRTVVNHLRENWDV